MFARRCRTRARRSGRTRSRRTTPGTMTATNENIVVTLPIGGVIRRVMVRFDRNGFAYVQDARTGQVLGAAIFRAHELGDRRSTSRPASRNGSRPSSAKTGVKVTDICPHLIGGKDQQPAAFSPRTNLFYVPGNQLCMDCEALTCSISRARRSCGAFTASTPADPDVQGEFIAWNAGDRHARSGASRNASRCGAARSRPPATWCSMAPGPLVQGGRRAHRRGAVPDPARIRASSAIR